MARGVAHSEETKAAVQAALLAGEAPADVAARFGLDKGTISRWKAQIPPAQLQQVATKKETDLEGLLVGYLTANFHALTAQATVATDEDYLRKYPPQQLAVLHGVMADKAARIAAILTGAAGRNEGSEEASEAPPASGAQTIRVEYFDDTTSTAAFGAGTDQG